MNNHVRLSDNSTHINTSSPRELVCFSTMKEVFSMAYIQSYKDQNYLFPPNIKDLFSENHVCYLIEQIADGMDYSGFDVKYAGVGAPAYRPRILVKLLAMAYVDSLRSSRRIAKNAQENVVYIFLAEKTSPGFRTISDFRKDNGELLKSVFTQLNSFAYEHGLIDLSHLSTDGTVLKANANDQKVIELEKLKKLDKLIDKYLDEANKVDEEEDLLYGERGMHELPKDLLDPKKRMPIVKKIVDKINESMKKRDTQDLKQIRKELHQVKHFMEGNGVGKYSFTDVDARFMLNKKKKIELSYNAQVTVDKNGLVVANSVVQDCDDRNQLVPAINRVEQDFGKLPKGTIITADPGFEKAKDLKQLDSRGYDLYVPGKKSKKADFTYDEKRDVYISPNAEVLKKVGSYFNKKRGEQLTIYKGIIDGKQRVIHALPEHALLNRIRKKLQSEEGKATYSLRKQTVETAIGDIKENKKFRGFLLRGLQKVKIEFNLTCIARNLVMINNMLVKKSVSGC